MKPRSVFIFVTLATVSVCAMLALTEVTLRVLERRGTGVSSELRFGELDSLTGWRATPDYAVTYHRKTADGLDHVVSYSTTKQGFRVYGDVATSRRKLLVIGDSFTHAVNVSTGHTYATKLADSLDMELFSYGAGGFGTLQELMVLQRWVDTIKPDVVVLQFCSNDFINNSWLLEARSTMNNNRNVRPYLGIDGAITYRNPFEHETFMNLSRRFRLFTLIGNQVLYKRKKSVETLIAANPDDAEMARSISVTRTLMQRFRDALPPQTKFFVFSADGATTRFRNFPDVEEVAKFSEVAEKAAAEIVTSLGATYIPGPASAVAEAESRGVTVHDIDGAHWSEAGHTIVASVLLRQLRPVLKPTSQAAAPM